MPRLTEKFTMWFDCPDDPDGGKVEIQHLTDQDIAEIRDKAQTTKLVYDQGKDTPTLETETFPAIDRRETCERAVKNWHNFFDESGQPMPCTRENRRKWADAPWFMALVNRSLAVVRGEAEKRAAEKRKN
jgi:hypothetical protein